LLNMHTMARTAQRTMKKTPAWLVAVVDQGVIAVTNFEAFDDFWRASGLAGWDVYSLISVTLLSSLGLVRTLIGLPGWLH
jgi:hypothetical protein